MAKRLNRTTVLDLRLHFNIDAKCGKPSKIYGAKSERVYPERDYVGWATSEIPNGIKKARVQVTVTLRSDKQILNLENYLKFIFSVYKKSGGKPPIMEQVEREIYRDADKILLEFRSEKFPSLMGDLHWIRVVLHKNYTVDNGIATFKGVAYYLTATKL